jgi:hypothetical protein
MTLIETLIMLIVSSLVMALILPMSSEGVRDNFRLAERDVAAGSRTSSEIEFRRLLRQAAPPLAGADGKTEDPPIAGNAAALRFPAESEGSLQCPGTTGYTMVRLRIVRAGEGGRLMCDTPGRTIQLMNWPVGEAQFAYSLDGAAWSGTWPLSRERAPLRGYFARNEDRETQPQIVFAETPLVRFVVRRGRVSDVDWIERAGDPSLTDPTSAAGARPQRMF